MSLSSRFCGCCAQSLEYIRFSWKYNSFIIYGMFRFFITFMLTLLKSLDTHSMDRTKKLLLHVYTDFLITLKCFHLLYLPPPSSKRYNILIFFITQFFKFNAVFVYLEFNKNVISIDCPIKSPQMADIFSMAHLTHHFPRITTTATGLTLATNSTMMTRYKFFFYLHTTALYLPLIKSIDIKQFQTPNHQCGTRIVVNS